jgi:uncharacterized paraquat-inducible protein A
MLNIGTTNSCAPVPPQHATLWRCEQCDSFISIHSVFIIDQAMCPACGTVQLKLCGTFDNILGSEIADA